ncbi:uncharacterized protein J3D65DRAFT_637579 [Phyllosticta citribraziliensis]|uniref:F-box domain-containing protein n=1 Tax=Phyllosticta citribraziliensis TaxID=989973 RepID=A0ABR1L855_9PEZI
MAYKKTSYKSSKPKLADQQQGSSLMQRLPQELRDKIYLAVFSSTRLSSFTAPNALALLRVCQRIHSEIGNTWLKQVLFNFETPEAMLNRLANIPMEKRTLIRHMRVSDGPLVLSFGDEDVFYRIYAALQLLPGLKLDRLTVLTGRVLKVAYESLDRLIKVSSGWKELYFISHTSMLLGYQTEPDPLAQDPYYYMRKPQPSSWQRQLEARDGSLSNPSVAVYRTKSTAFNGAILDPEKRVSFEQKLPSSQTLAQYAQTEDSTISAAGEREKEMLVIVKRGQGVDYELKRDYPSYDHADINIRDVQDIRRDTRMETWREIKVQQKMLRREYDDSDEDDIDIHYPHGILWDL